MDKLDAFRIPIAHRGLHDRSEGIIENTRRAVSEALDKGYGVEVDLRPSSDDVPMVFHDLDLDRLLVASGRIDDYSTAELQQLEYQEDSDPMMTLGDLLQLVDGKAPLLIEIKSDWCDLKTAFLDEIAKTISPYTGPVALMSFDPAIVRHLTSVLPDRPRGLLSGRYAGHGWWSEKLSVAQRFALRNLLHTPYVRPDFIAYDIRGLPALAPVLLRRVFGVPLFAWTVRTPAERARAERWADTVIFEDYRP